MDNWSLRKRSRLPTIRSIGWGSKNAAFIRIVIRKLKPACSIMETGPDHCGPAPTRLVKRLLSVARLRLFAPGIVDDHLRLTDRVAHRFSTLIGVFAQLNFFLQ